MDDLSSLARGQPPLDADIAFLVTYGFDSETLQVVNDRARLYGTSAARMMFTGRLIREHDYFRLLAHHLHLPFAERPEVSADPFFHVPSAQRLESLSRYVQNANGVAAPMGYTAPDADIIALLEETRPTCTAPHPLADRLTVVPRSANRAALLERCRPGLSDLARNGLNRAAPWMSARQTITPIQLVALFATVQAFVLAIILAPETLKLALHLAVTGFFLACVVLRLLAAASFDMSRRQVPDPATTPIDRTQDHLLPVYSILVPLYREAGQVEPLLRALMQIDWPAERLEIKLICEDDDDETCEEVERILATLPQGTTEMLRVPPSEPRTKPKALDYALPLCTGEFIVIYDAEDRPSPRQLREAFTRFHNGGSGSEELACLQAPLVIYNHAQGLWPSLFAVEYAALFDGLLPFLARSRSPLPLPLGGTSNHFRRSALEAAGGWDPFNVTEDADLGMRLARLGYRIGVLRHPTYEEAPAGLVDWLPQRSRWFKGWYQTWLVHMRTPVRLGRELGWRGWLTFHVMVTGMCISALFHPLLLAFMLWWITIAVEQGWNAVLTSPLFALDVLTVLLGYFAYGWLAWRTLPTRRLGHLRGVLWGVPIYWMALSIAAWRALWHLIMRPHQWEKTPHRLGSR